MNLLSKEKPVTVVCFGDSNTKYYLGDQQKDGPETDSYPARLQQLFSQRGYSQVTVVNAGFPDTQTDFALEHFEQEVAERQADICIYGFGTNCIRQPEANLEGYLEDTRQLFLRMKQHDIQPVSLLIPWFSQDYCGLEGQRRLPDWNTKLCSLCFQEGVPVLDTYQSFSGAPQLFFNETQTPKRHYSALAAQALAEMAFALIAPYIR